MHKYKPIAEQLLAQILDSPYGRWVLMNMLVWSLGLYAIAFSIRLFGIMGAPIGVILAGSVVGAGQSWVLQQLLPIAPRQWTRSSVLGTVLGVLPIGLLFLWVLLVAAIGLNSVLFILGAIFGGILGASQVRILHSILDEKVAWWVLANILAGALCAPLSLSGVTFVLPVFCSLGPLTFGLLTAWALRYLMQSWDDELDEA